MDKFLYISALLLTLTASQAFKLDPARNDVDRISNGLIAIDNQFPYAVSLQQLSMLQYNTRGHRCGGVLITFSHVLTAASCLYDLVEGTAVGIAPNQYRIFAGASLLTDDTSPDRSRNIANFTIHPDHILAPALLNDLAIITLATPFLNTTVQPLSLPAANFDPADFTLCTLAGWGATVSGVNASVNLRFTTKYIYSHSLCTQIYNSVVGVSNVFPSMVCAASYDILSSGCQGDQGNALVCNNQLTGILFFTNQCQPSSFPEIYTRVSNYTNWIRGVTGSASTFRPGLALLAFFTMVQMLAIKIVS